MNEKRSIPRCAFAADQRIARVVRGSMPSSDDFEAVRCIDVSRKGFSFYRATRPDFEDLVVVLGLPPDIVCLTARVVHCKLIEFWGHSTFRIGCQFTGRAKLNDDTHFALQRGDFDTAVLFLTDDEQALR